ncbi:MAG: Uncharacterized protein XE11_0516 [Methanomicrobiales archaeon 53_19]|jgi:hypothetical protein|uniref:TfuA-related McrA-glycine thioamidation protein n=1 Tax=Methanocalculus sp. TaxID=2004547 RepID=UPI0007468BBB|nr:TfuA-related McrA-glycine thioamidation protein [Methanocalculus sp.]KUK71193.1 MAG: Uncharacterized protein XD88_0186 [Methanocalculus sp. 52_23]KUL04736.1 MAG: Uncharacterized protein XE11_0516 [Methanomicrobiales archaeon 53_19]HIJ06952.1 TfuA-related McrA-glycine thioamidation protein [Methanocalculus sp.]
MHGAVVYLGPSLPHEEARVLCPEAAFLPPIRRGDLTTVIGSGITLVCIIDGYFFQDSAVGHREILSLLRSGIMVIGASSMGALRAAELDSLGMEGVGLIYSLYRNGTLVSDDEVALVFDPETLSPLSVPLVNIRCTFRRAREDGFISLETEALLIRTATDLFYPERTYERIVSVLGDEERDRLLDYLSEYAIDQKRSDAIEALTKVHDILTSRQSTGKDEYN